MVILEAMDLCMYECCTPQMKLNFGRLLHICAFFYILVKDQAVDYVGALLFAVH